MASGTRRGKREDRRDARSETLDRQLPYDLDAEKGILGAMLLLPETCDEIALLVREQDFFDQAIFSAEVIVHRCDVGLGLGGDLT